MFPALLQGMLKKKEKFYMTPLPDQNIKVVKQWVKQAKEDLRLAKHAFTLSSGVPFNLIAYHAQQCAEKWPAPHHRG